MTNWYAGAGSPESMATLMAAVKDPPGGDPHWILADGSQ